MAVPDNIVKQIAEGRPVVLALLCSGLQTYYLPAAEERVEIAGEATVTGTNIDAWSTGAVGLSDALPRLFV